MTVVDVAVIGGGTAGLIAAKTARAAGKAVVLMEEDRLGGECTWDGCVPSKTLIRAARLRHDARRGGAFGIFAREITVDFPAVMARVQQIVHEIALTEDASHLQAVGIRVIHGHANLLDRHAIDINGERVIARKIILSTGGRPAIPQIDGLDDVPHLTNESLFSIDHLPEHLLVLGGGSIGLEMAQAFTRLGSRVTVIDALGSLLSREDPEIAEMAESLLRQEGIDFLLGATVRQVSDAGAAVRLSVTANGQPLSLEGDALLIGTGRKPNVDGLGLEAAGVKVEKNGIVVDDHLRTTAGDVYAAGDVTGGYLFTHVAAYQGRIAAENAVGKRSKANYRVVPWVTFTDPEIAHVGLTEPEARRKHRDVRVVRLPYGAIDRAVIDGDAEGMIKVVVGRKPILGWTGGGEILGAHLIGAHAGELLHEFVVSMQARTFAGRIAQAIHAYPTLSIGDQAAMSLLFPSGRAVVDTRSGLSLNAGGAPD